MALWRPAGPMLSVLNTYANMASHQQPNSHLLYWGQPLALSVHSIEGLNMHLDNVWGGGELQPQESHPEAMFTSEKMNHSPPPPSPHWAYLGS